MWDFLFEDRETGEEFFVECDSKREAFQIAWENFGEDNVEYKGRYSVEDAEMMGLDTY